MSFTQLNIYNGKNTNTDEIIPLQTLTDQTTNLFTGKVGPYIFALNKTGTVAEMT